MLHDFRGADVNKAIDHVFTTRLLHYGLSFPSVFLSSFFRLLRTADEAVDLAVEHFSGFVR